MSGTCPICSATVRLDPSGRLIRHPGTQMCWSGKRWFRTTCEGSGWRPMNDDVRVRAADTEEPR